MLNQMSRCSCVVGLSLVAVLLSLRTTSALADEPAKPRWENLFDGKSLGRWKTITKYDFTDHGKIEVRDGVLWIGRGSPASGVRYTGPLPKSNYELSLEAKRVEGGDFFCGLTFPVGASFCTLIVGGWGGSIVGLSNVDDESAADNETCHHVDFRQDTWYAIRLRVTDRRIQVWIDRDRLINLPTANRKLSIWWEQEPARPLGVSTWDTGAAVRNLRVRLLEKPNEKAVPAADRTATSRSVTWSLGAMAALAMAVRPV